VVPVCVRCRYPLAHAHAMTTPHGWMHVACGTGPVENDVLEPHWIALIYAVMLVPFLQPILVWLRRGLTLAWRERFPHRVAQLRFHILVSNLGTFFFLMLLFCAFVLWMVWRTL
jgi:hypothetical protein